MRDVNSTTDRLQTMKVTGDAVVALLLLFTVTVSTMTTTMNPKFVACKRLCELDHMQCIASNWDLREISRIQTIENPCYSFTKDCLTMCHLKYTLP
ncbi:hypothetical protein NP493_691g02023 [Ridgeia piscesae]|uniref:Uncharacterized protein n=1 Tax=Ridgeia piscesae TaxID=27915 RepID=A0AAD9NPM5_RIDPI|nr:hypothetical protein NP493_691g02023 [Ridgeia piscesae]